VVPLSLSGEANEISVGWFPKVNRWSFWYHPREGVDTGANNRIEFFDEHWKLLSRIDLAESYSTNWGDADWRKETRAEVAKVRAEENVYSAMIYALCNRPMLALMNLKIRMIQFSPDPNRIDLYDMEEQMGMDDPWYSMPALGVLVLSGALMGIATWRYGVRMAWLWVAGAMVFGPVMVGVLIATHSLPVRMKCPACGKGRFLWMKQCGNCGAENKSPELNGTEVFAKAGAA
jgi:hypothetical protein